MADCPTKVISGQQVNNLDKYYVNNNNPLKRTVGYLGLLWLAPKPILQMIESNDPDHSYSSKGFPVRTQELYQVILYVLVITCFQGIAEY